MAKVNKPPSQAIDSAFTWQDKIEIPKHSANPAAPGKAKADNAVAAATGGQAPAPGSDYEENPSEEGKQQPQR